MPKFKLKGTQDDQSGAIIQSFDSKWHESLLKNEVSVVFRKTGPRRFQPSVLYAYLTKPISAIVARTAITGCEYMPTPRALRLAPEGKIDKEELRCYASDYHELLVMRIGRVLKARNLITFEYLAEHYDFWPSSTFIPLSAKGVEVLEQLGRFEEA